ncbi:LLM class flavin-dependent oxidoreductase [Embleya sp. NPDC005575]|uniref:LLM class flavin-dependent oxidoreductase n=1 Tax=Embleya sp. NPDC005575 TaxID=3156892 RepID=UPI0033B8EFD5
MRFASSHDFTSIHSAWRQQSVRVLCAVPDRRARAPRSATFGYLAQVAAAAEQVGFETVLTPVGAGCPDPWIVCSALIERTSTLRFLVAFRPGFVLPTRPRNRPARSPSSPVVGSP